MKPNPCSKLAINQRIIKRREKEIRSGTNTVFFSLVTAINIKLARNPIKLSSYSMTNI